MIIILVGDDDELCIKSHRETIALPSVGVCTKPCDMTAHRFLDNSSAANVCTKASPEIKGIMN
jgi:hypothetical protein